MTSSSPFAISFVSQFCSHSQVAEKGYVDQYSGIRISSSGKRFRIIETIIWEVRDDEERRVGQAATFPKWEWL